MAPVVRRTLKTLLLEYYVVYGDSTRLRLAESAKVNNALFNTVSGYINVEESVFFGFNVSVLTGTHDYNLTDIRRQDAILDAVNDITIGEGAWIATNVTVIGPAVIGKWAVIGAGSLVTGDIPDYAIAVGIPARVVRYVDNANQEGAA